MTLLYDKDTNNHELVMALFDYIEALNDWVGDLAKKLGDKWGVFIDLNKMLTKNIFGIDVPDVPNAFKGILDELGLGE